MRKEKRGFTFGCSFTNIYEYQTWADIVSLKFDKFKNYGAAGAGNYYIYHKLLESYYMDNLNQSDYVFIMFTSSSRYDRIDDTGDWYTTGNVYTTDYYKNGDFLEKYWSYQQGYYMSWDSIISCISLLDRIGCNYKIMSAFDSDLTEYFPFPSTINQSEILYHSIITDELKKLLPPPSLHHFSENIIKQKRYMINGNLDNHPTVKTHGLWVKEYLPEYYDEETEIIIQKWHEQALSKYKIIKKLI